jgi:hypothetical protein
LNRVLELKQMTLEKYLEEYIGIYVKMIGKEE